MDRNSAAIPITVDKRVVGPTALVRAHTAASYHLLHCVLLIIDLKPRKSHTYEPE